MIRGFYYGLLFGVLVVGSSWLILGLPIFGVFTMLFLIPALPGLAMSDIVRGTLLGWADLIVFIIGNLTFYAVAGTSIGWFINKRKIKPGHCPHCNYNLTGNESGVCPECGTEIQP